MNTRCAIKAKPESRRAFLEIGHASMRVNQSMIARRGKATLAPSFTLLLSPTTKVVICTN
jgi:hypothetical protein